MYIYNSLRVRCDSSWKVKCDLFEMLAPLGGLTVLTVAARASERSCHCSVQFIYSGDFPVVSHYRKRRYIRGRRPSLLDKAAWMCSYVGISVRSPRAATAGLLRSILVATLLMSLAVTLPGQRVFVRSKEGSGRGCSGLREEFFFFPQLTY